MDRAYTIHEFGRAFKIGRTKTWQLIRDGQLRAVSVGSKRLIRADDAEAWLAGLGGNSKNAAV